MEIYLGISYDSKLNLEIIMEFSDHELHALWKLCLKCFDRRACLRMKIDTITIIYEYHYSY